MSKRGAQKAALDGLTNPKSVAIVGVSERPAAIGTRVLKNLRMLGYAGAIYPVNRDGWAKCKNHYKKSVVGREWIEHSTYGLRVSICKV